MLRPVPRPRTKTDEKTLRGRPVWIDETGYVTGEKGTRYSEVTTTIPWGTEWITAPSVDEDGSKLSDEEVARRLKDNEGRDFLTGEKLPTFESEPEASAYAEWRSDTMFDEEQIEKGYKPVLEQEQYEEDVEETLTDKLMRKAKPFTDEVKGFADYLMTPSQHFDEGGLLTQTEEVFSLDSEGRRRRADKERESTTVKDAATFVASATPIIGDAMAAKEVYDELQKDDPNYYLAGALGGAAIVGLVPGLGDAAASAIRAGARKTFDTVKRIEVDPTAVGSMGGNVRLKPKEDVTPQISNIDYQKKMSEFDKAETADEWQESVGGYVENSRNVSPTIRTPELESSAKDLLDGKITREQHLDNVDKYKPVDPWDALPREPSSKATVFSLKPDQREKGKFILPDKAIKKLDVEKSSLKLGDKFNGRLDIPAYNRFDTWIVAGTSTAEKGVTHYSKAIHYKGVDDKPVRFLASQKTSEKIGSGEAGKTGYATVSGEIKDLDVEEIRDKATKYLNDPKWTQVGFDPRRQGGFYVRNKKNKHVPVREADEVIQIGPLVLAKNAKLDLKHKGFNEGGMAMKDSVNMGYALGGEVDAIDPVSGNEIPPGSTAKEVRDDIPTMLSEGEYVVPADVFKFYGLKFFEDLRENAKAEMAMMEQEGRIGGQPVPEEGELTEDEMTLLGEVMGMAEGGMNQMQPQQPQPPQPMMMGQQMMPPKPQPTQFNKPVGFDEGGMTDAFGNPIGPTVDAPEAPEQQKFLQDIDPTSTDIYGIDKQKTDPSANVVGVQTDDQTASTGDGSGMKTVFYFHPDGRRIQVLMLNGKPISSVPADFSEFKEDTIDNRKPDPTAPDPTDDISGSVGQTKSSGSRKTDDDERRVEAKTIETLKRSAEKKRITDFNNTLATGTPDEILGEFKKAKTGQGLSALLPGIIGLVGSGLAKKNVNRIKDAYLARAKELKLDMTEAQKALDEITIGSATMEGITEPFKQKDAMSKLFGQGFYDEYEAKYDVSEYIGMTDSISGRGVVGYVKDGYSNLDARQQQHFDNAVRDGKGSTLKHFALVATSNAAKDQFAIDNADDIQDIQDLIRKGDDASLAKAKKLADVLKGRGYEFGNMKLGDHSMDEVIKLGSSALTAKKLGKAEKEKGLFGKTESTEDENGNKNNSPIRSKDDDRNTIFKPKPEPKPDPKPKPKPDPKPKPPAPTYTKPSRDPYAEPGRPTKKKEKDKNSIFNKPKPEPKPKPKKKSVGTFKKTSSGKGYIGGFDKGGLMERKK